MNRLACGCYVWEPSDRNTRRQTQHPLWRPGTIASECAHHKALRAGTAEPTTKHDKAFVASLRLIELEEKHLNLMRQLAVALVINQSDNGEQA